MENEDGKFLRNLLLFFFKTVIFTIALISTLYLIKVNNLNVIKIVHFSKNGND
jgi:hypothetical protein